MRRCVPCGAGEAVPAGRRSSEAGLGTSRLSPGRERGQGAGDSARPHSPDPETAAPPGLFRSGRAALLTRPPAGSTGSRLGEARGEETGPPHPQPSRFWPLLSRSAPGLPIGGSGHPPTHPPAPPTRGGPSYPGGRGGQAARAPEGQLRVWSGQDRGYLTAKTEAQNGKRLAEAT